MGYLSELKGIEKPVTEWLDKMDWTLLKSYNPNYKESMQTILPVALKEIRNRILKRVE